MARRNLSMARQHARDLIPALAELLAEAGWSAGTIEVVGVDIGPGSYTGLRVGVMTAKMFAYATGARVMGVDAMSLLAEGAPREHRIVWGVVDAQQNRIYAQRFERRDSSAIPLANEPMEVMNGEDWSRLLEVGDFVTGPGLSRMAPMVPAGVTCAAPGDWSPTVESMAANLNRRRDRDLWDDPWTLTPLYLRDSSAQIRWDARLAEGGRGE